MFAGSAVRVMAGALFTGLLVWASVSDVRSRRIPNLVVLLLMLGGLGWSLATGGIAGGVRGVSGLLVGFLIWIPFYAVRVLGAGDVKLFAAAGAWLGPAGALTGAVVAMVAGGALAVALLVAQRRLREGLEGTALLWTRLTRLSARPVVAAEAAPSLDKHKQLPYGVALAIGAAVVAWFPHFSF